MIVLEISLETGSTESHATTGLPAGLNDKLATVANAFMTSDTDADSTADGDGAERSGDRAMTR